MLRRTYDRLMVLAAGPRAELWLAVAAFAEGVFFPIPPDTMLMPMVLANRARAWRYAAICTLASVTGGATGYAVGRFLHPVGHWLFSLAGHPGSLDKLQGWYAKWGVVLLAVPIPYKLVAIASGLADFSFVIFITASILIRGARFFLAAGLVRAYGAPIQSFIERRLAWVASGLALIIVGAFLALKLAL